MSHKIGNVVVICVEPDRKCEFCGKVAECRPYGPRGEHICYDCAAKNPEVTERQMRRHLLGESVM